MKLWIVGIYRINKPWEFQGVFDSEEKALEHCLTDKYFIGPTTLNMEQGGEETTEWEGSYYPSEKKGINN